MQHSLKHYIYLMRLDKPIGIFLLLWPTLWALWLATQQKPDVFIVAIFCGGVLLTRSAGCIINDVADREIDKFVERTQSRPLTTGVISVQSALILFVVLMLSAFGLVLFLNPFTILLAVIGALLATLYPFLKRWIAMPQAGLGLAFAWGVPMAFAAETNTLPWLCWLLFLATVLWVMMYDTLYAMVDRADDLKIGIKSSAILFGAYDRVIIALLQISFLLCMLFIGFYLTFNKFYFLSLFLAGLLFGYQDILIRHRERQKCFKAFLNNNGVGLIIFLGIACG